MDHVCLSLFAFASLSFDVNYPHRQTGRNSYDNFRTVGALLFAYLFYACTVSLTCHRACIRLKLELWLAHSAAASTSWVQIPGRSYLSSPYSSSYFGNIHVDAHKGKYAQSSRLMRHLRLFVLKRRKWSTWLETKSSPLR